MARDVEIKVRLRTEEAQRQIREFRESLAETRGQSVARSLGLAPDNLGIAGVQGAANFVGGLSGAAGNALSRPGAGYASAELAAESQAYSQLGAAGATVGGIAGSFLGGALGGPPGAYLGAALGGLGGKLVGDIGGGLLSQDTNKEQQAREIARARVLTLTQTRAAQGIETTPEQLAFLFERAMIVAMRQVNNEEAVTRQLDAQSGRSWSR